MRGKSVLIQLSRCGGIAMLHDDEIDLKEFGEIEVTRASHIEYAHDGWFVQSAKTLHIIAGGFKTRQAALDWEKEYYSPIGAGWKELEVG